MIKWIIAIPVAMALLLPAAVPAAATTPTPIAAEQAAAAPRNNTPGCVTAAEWGKAKKRMKTHGIVKPNWFYAMSGARFKTKRVQDGAPAFRWITVHYKACNRSKPLVVVYEWLSPTGWRLRQGGPFPALVRV